MAAPPVESGKDNDADWNTRNIDVKSEIMAAGNDDHGVLQNAVPACGDPLVTLGSLGGRFADDVRFPDYEDGNTTECSSSFDASYSLSDEDVESEAMEVDSMFQSHINIDRPTLPKSKVTADWRNYIGPVMWRCQWLELRMKDLLSQVEKYDKELAIIKHEKDLQLEMMKADCPNSELLQLDDERNIMKRRKRKRDEDTIDSSLSTENHLILSYYNEKQKKKTETDELLDDDDNGFNSLGTRICPLINNAAVEDTKSSHDLSDTLGWLRFKDNDTVSEQYYLRGILFSINEMQSRIVSLQNNLRALNAKGHTQKTKKVQKKKTLQSVLQKDTGSVDITRPDEDEVTFDMLFGTDNPLLDAGTRGLYKESDGDVFIYNQAATDEGYCQLERISQEADKHVELVKSVHEIPCSEGNNSALSGHEPAPIVTLVNKRGPKPQNKRSTKTEEDFDNSNAARTMLVAVDPRRSQRVRKPKIL